MPSRKLVLHIGTEKTGSTSLQRMLAENRAPFEKHGVLVPRNFGRSNHIKVVSAALDDDVYDLTKSNLLAKKGWTIAEMRKNLAADLRKILQEHRDATHIVVTSELIHSRLVRESEIKRLADIFAPFVDEVQVIMFLRRQDRLAVSRFGTALLAGYSGDEDAFGDLGGFEYIRTPVHKLPNSYDHYYDYRKLIERFIPEFGEAAITPVIYKEGANVTAAQFLNVANLSHVENGIRVSEPVLNKSIGTEAHWVMRELNRQLPFLDSTGRADACRRELMAKVVAECSGRKRQYDRKTAKAFLRRFGESNEWVRWKFFSNQATLFDNDFSEYADSCEADEITSHNADKVAEYLAWYEQNRTHFTERKAGANFGLLGPIKRYWRRRRASGTAR